MAGDWIKMQGNLWTSPKVVRIMSATKADKCRVIGALFRVWCLFDEHTEDGVLDGYTPFLLNDELRIDGFAEAMMSIDWLFDLNGEALQVPDFDDHMSESAKKRAQDTKRKRKSRKVSATQADKNTTREEKRREDIKESKKKKITLSEYRANCESLGQQAIPEDSIVFVNSEKLGMPSEIVLAAWQCFVGHWVDTNPDGKKTDWLMTFNNCIKSDGYGAFKRNSNQDFYLTDKGRTALQLSEY